MTTVGAFTVVRDAAHLLRPVVSCLQAFASPVIVAVDDRSVDGSMQAAVDLGALAIDVRLRGASYEHTLNDIVGRHLATDYVFWLHDDELVGPAFLTLLPSLCGSGVAWRFPHLNLWPDARHYITSAPYVGDHQLRLAPRDLWLERGGWPEHIHASPSWPCRFAPCHIWHYKFIVKALSLREERLAAWASEYPRAAEDHYRAFSVVEGREVAIAPADGIEPPPEWDSEVLSAVSV